MTSDERWIVLLGLQDTKHIRLKIRKIQVDALEWARANEGIKVLFKIQDLKGEDQDWPKTSAREEWRSTLKAATDQMLKDRKP